jgi:serine protease Do
MLFRSIAAVGLLTASLLLAGCGRSENKGAAPNAIPPGKATGTASADSDRDSGFRPSTRSRLSSDDVSLLEQIDRENTRVVNAAVPSLVRITALTEVDPHAQLLGLPFHFPGVPHGVRTEVPSYGSGVIISRDGYVVTNEHVVRDAHTVSIQLHDKTNLDARLVASDPDTDLAVLKVEASDLPAIPWGDSDRVQVGQQVFALGNPFNLDTSVSRGIVSGVGRNLPDVESSSGSDIHPAYEDYIQTDAAINVGNSGGALVNIHGELIGINAAIASFTQGSEGVGFSIPSNLVRTTVEQLLKQGRTVRGYLGVRLPVRVDDGVAEQLGLDSVHGALLAGVQQSSPADKARLRPVDCIVAIDGHKIESLPQFRLIVAQIPIGKAVEVDYIRAGATHSATVTIAEMPKNSDPPDVSPAPASAAGTVASSAAASLTAGHVLAGVQVADLTEKSRGEFGVDPFVTSGVVVTDVPDGSPADQRGLLRGDVIEIACAQRGAIEPLARVADFTSLVRHLRPEQPVVLLVHHGKLSGDEDRSSNFLLLAPVAR